jgi:gamma-glutamylcyclotransferase (GGCT)/AIG2-like uncharacterized protein YtfP
VSDAAADPPPALFAYGSLTVPDVLRAVLGRVPEHRPARVTGWRAAALRGRTYPGLVAGDGVVAGVVLTDLTEDERATLDAFEGPAYALTPVELDDGAPAVAYAWLDAAEVLAEAWDVERFRRDDLPAFLEMCAAWSAGGPGP